MMDFDTSPTQDPKERLARRRAGAKMGWLIHALVYVCVNAGLALIAWHGGGSWNLYPLASWGLGLAIHGLAVLLGGSRGGVYERLLQAERDKLQARH